MKLPVYIAMLIIAMVVSVNGQNSTKIVVINIADSIPVAGAHIITEDRNVEGTTNDKGICFVTLTGNTSTVTISHLTFKDTIIRIMASEKQHIVYLRPGTKFLPAFAVYASPVNLIPDKPWFVTSYLHCNEGLLLLAYPQRKLTNQSLFLLDSRNEVLASIPWKEQGTLVMDAANDIWLKCKTISWKVELNRHQISIGPEMIPTIEFESGIERINLIIDKRYYFGHHKLDNQWLDYYCYDADADRAFVIESISDPLGLKLRETRDIFETNEFERRFGEMCFFAPVFAPIYKYGSGFLIFDFARGVIRFYDSLNVLSGLVDMDFFKGKNLKKSLLNDRDENRFFAVFEDKGILSLHEIDISTGKLLNMITIPSFIYIDQITVHQGQVYFLYKEQTFNEYRKIFRMSLPDNTLAGGK